MIWIQFGHYTKGGVILSRGGLHRLKIVSQDIDQKNVSQEID